MTAGVRLALPTLAVIALGVLVYARGCDREAPARRGAPPAKDEPAEPDLLTVEPGRAASTASPALAAGKPGPAVRSGPVRVKVVGPGGAPLPGVGLSVTGGAATHPLHEGVTDERGVFAFRAAVPYDGSHCVQARAPEPWRKKRTFIPAPLELRTRYTDRMTIHGPELVFHAKTGLHVDVYVVGAETFDEVAGAAVRCRKSLPRLAQRLGGEWGNRFLMTPGIGRRTVMHWDVTPPKGWVQWERSWIEATVSPYAETLECVLPLRRQVSVTVTPVDSEGTPVEARVYGLSVAGRTPGTWRFEGDAYGRLHVHGVPFLRDEILDIGVCRKDLTGPARATAVIPDHPATPIDLQVTLPDDGEIDDDGNASIGIGGSAGGSFKGRVRKPKVSNSVLVTVLRRNGEPAFGATVELPLQGGRTDAKGQVRFHRVAAGPTRVRVESAGVLPVEGSLHVSETGESRIILREGRGGTVDLMVVDDAGNPLPCARFTLKTASGLPWIDMASTAQRIDPFVDHLGRRVLGNVEPGALEITVTWGSRRRVERLRVVEGERAPLRVVLRRPAR